MEKIPKFDKRRDFNKAVEPGKKNPNLINVGPTFIPDYRVCKNVNTSVIKELLPFRLLCASGLSYQPDSKTK